MKWFNNTRIGTKIITGFLVMALIAGIIGLISVTSLIEIDKKGSELYEINTKPLENLLKIAVDYQRTRVNLRDLMIDKTDSDLEQHFKTIDDLSNDLSYNLNQFEKSIRAKEISDEYKQLIDNIKKYNTIEKQYADFIKSGKLDEALKLLRGDGFTEAKKVDESIKRLIGHKVKQANQKADDNTQSARRAIYIMVLIIAVGVVIAIGLGIFIRNVITRQLGGEPSEVAEISSSLANGDFTMDIKLKDGDTSSALAAMKNMTETLDKTMTEIILASQNLAQAVEQISSGNQSLSQRTSEQASALEEIASTVEESTSAVNLNYQNSINASSKANESSHIAQKGGSLVEEAVQSINEINSSAKKIGEITSVINEIAFQTNLLALNAAVEAARAGEQGRGFAVVAGEVRNLAQRAGSAAKEIAQLINDTVVKIDDGTDKTFKSGESLKEIIGSVNKVSELVNEISASTAEQKQGMDQVSSAIEQLDSMTQHNAALVEETAAASEEMANQAQELITLMLQFKTRESLSNTESTPMIKRPAGKKGKSNEPGKGNANRKDNSLTNKGDGKDYHQDSVAANVEMHDFEQL